MGHGCTEERMKIVCGWLPGWIAAMILLIGGNALGQSLQAPPISEPVRTPRVRLELRTDKRVYSLGDEILLDAQLYNRTQERVYVYNQIGSGFMSGLVLHIMDAAGTGVQSRPLVDPPAPPQEVHDWKVLTPIDPATFYGVRVSARLQLFLQARRIQIKADLYEHAAAGSAGRCISAAAHHIAQRSNGCFAFGHDRD
jgi:hypothetical protein